MAEIPGIRNGKHRMYHREVILKKEGKTWIEYYAVLVDNSLIFNRKDEKTGQIIPNNMTMIEINSKTQCEFSENKTCYRFPFWLQNGKANYQFKCETKLHRYKWLFAIRLCASGKPPEPLPKMIPTHGRVRNSSSKKQQQQQKPAQKTTTTPTGQLTTKTSATLNTKSLKVTNATIKDVIKTTNLKRSNTIDNSLKPSPKIDRFSISNGFKMNFLSKSFDKERRGENPLNMKNGAKTKSSKQTKRKPDSTINNTRQPQSVDKSKSNDSRPRSKTVGRCDVDFEESVVVNKFVKDSMSDIRPTHLEALQLSGNNNNKDGRPSDEDLTPANECYRCVSCNESFSKAQMAKTLNHCHNNTLKKQHKSTVPLEYELDNHGKKIIEKVELQPDDIDLNDEHTMCSDLYPTGDLKVPVENDELDNYSIKTMKYRSDGHIETFTPTLKLPRNGLRRHTSNGTITVDRFGNITNVSNSSSLQVESRRSSLPGRLMIIKQQVMAAERAHSLTSLQRRTIPEAQRRENSAPLLKFSRHNLK